MASPIVGIGEILWDMLPDGPRPGGAPFNFAFHCHQLGHAACIVSRVGADEAGDRLRAEVRRLGLSDQYIQIDSQHPTGSVAVTLDPHGLPSYQIVENVAYDHLEWNEGLQQLADDCRAVCFGTLAQRHDVARGTVQRFLTQAQRSPSRIIICDINLRPPFDDAGVVEESIQQCRWLKINSDEWTILQKRNGLLGETAVRDFIARKNLSLLCITLGSQGARVVTATEDCTIPGVPVQAADTVGAGDAFTASLITQFLEKRLVPEAIKFSNAYAALVATRPGGTPRVERAEVAELC